MNSAACILITLSLALSLTVSTVQSAEYYVSTSTGSNTPGGGSQESPWKTIKYALSRVNGSADDPASIYVAQGTYYEYEISMKPYVSIYGGCRAYPMYIQDVSVICLPSPQQPWETTLL